MAQQYVFTCPECAEEIAVDATILNEMLSTGCVLCTATILPSHFVPAR